MAHETPENELLSVSDLKDVLVRDTRDVKRAAEIRLLHLTQIVEAYERGDIDAKEADKQYGEYYLLWGEPAGICHEHLSDEQVLEAVKEEKRQWQEKQKKKSFDRYL